MGAFVLPALAGLIFIGISISGWMIFKPERKPKTRVDERPRRRPVRRLP